jgi:hypothetical protein
MFFYRYTHNAALVLTLLICFSLFSGCSKTTPETVSPQPPKKRIVIVAGETTIGDRVVESDDISDEGMAVTERGVITADRFLRAPRRKQDLYSEYLSPSQSTQWLQQNGFKIEKQAGGRYILTSTRRGRGMPIDRTHTALTPKTLTLGNLEFMLAVDNNNHIRVRKDATVRNQSR